MDDKELLREFNNEQNEQNYINLLLISPSTNKKEYVVYTDFEMWENKLNPKSGIDRYSFRKIMEDLGFINIDDEEYIKFYKEKENDIHLMFDDIIKVLKVYKKIIQ